MYVLPITYCLMQKHTPGMFLTDFHMRKYTGGIISRVDIFLTVTPVNKQFAPISCIKHYGCIFLLQAITDHKDIAEAAVVAKPDNLKGHVPVGICVIKAGKICILQPVNITLRHS